MIPDHIGACGGNFKRKACKCSALGRVQITQRFIPRCFPDVRYAAARNFQPHVHLGVWRTIRPYERSNAAVDHAGGYDGDVHGLHAGNRDWRAKKSPAVKLGFNKRKAARLRASDLADEGQKAGF